jgi:hypothetical protein
MSEVEDLRKALAEIAKVAGAASRRRPVRDDGYAEGYDDEPPVDTPGCSIKALPKRLLIKAASFAAEVNPANAPMRQVIGGDPSMGLTDPMRIAVLTQKYWGPATRTLSVSFMESPPRDLRQRIVSHMNAWTRTGGISFALTNGVGDVRVTLAGDGYWSYLGTDIRLIPSNRPTMSLQDFSMSTPESEYRRVVRHETGHTLGFPHEHLRRDLVDLIDRRKAYAYFRATQGWDEATVDAQVLTPLSNNSIFGTPVDQTSIMCYQLPGSITKSGRPIVGGLDINATDYNFAGRIYPKGRFSPPRAVASSYEGDYDSADDAWPESEDVEPTM